MLEYFDAAATTPTHPLVVEAMLPYFTEIYGNPSSNHEYGKQARVAVETAREQVADLLNVFPDEVIFTSGATEAINLGIFGYWMANQSKGNHIITVVTEHAAVLNTCANLEQFGVDVTRLRVDEYGRIDFNQLESSIRRETLLVAVMHVNNETGLIHDINAIANICAKYDVAYFTDATQAVGHLSVDYSSPDISMLAISGHKFYGPKGVGALIIKRKVQIRPLFHGGGQEFSRRPGSIPTPLVVGLGYIADFIKSNLCGFTRSPDIEGDLRKRNIITSLHLQTLIPPDIRSPHLLALYSTKYESDVLVEKLIKEHNIVTSTGSACNAGLIEYSRVIKAIRGVDTAKRFIRISR